MVSRAGPAAARSVGRCGGGFFAVVSRGVGVPAGLSVLGVGVRLLVGFALWPPPGVLLWPPGAWWPTGPMGPPMFIALASELVEALVSVSR